MRERRRERPSATLSPSSSSRTSASSHQLYPSPRLKSHTPTQVRNKWGATALDNAQFADHHGSISLLTDDPSVRKAAEFKLELERTSRLTKQRAHPRAH